jgi:hypothetical protein
MVTIFHKHPVFILSDLVLIYLPGWVRTSASSDQKFPLNLFRQAPCRISLYWGLIHCKLNLCLQMTGPTQ